MKTLMKRATTLAWICAIIVFGAGTTVFASAAIVRTFTPLSVYEHPAWIGSELGQVQEFRRPTMFETINGMGVQPDFLALVTSGALIAVFLGACVVPWWYVRQTPAGEPEDSQTMQELHRLAERLSHRIDSLEGILLDPARNTATAERKHA